METRPHQEDLGLKRQRPDEPQLQQTSPSPAGQPKMVLLELVPGESECKNVKCLKDHHLMTKFEKDDWKTGVEITYHFPKSTYGRPFHSPFDNLTRTLQDCFMRSTSIGALKWSKAESFNYKTEESEVHLQLASGCRVPTVCIRAGGPSSVLNTDFFTSLVRTCSVERVVLVIEIGENLKENPEVGHWGHWDNSKKLYLCSYEKEN